jgi:hypothetical protein
MIQQDAGRMAEGNGSNGESKTWDRVAALYQPLPARAETLRRVPETPGADEEPWDVVISSLATDEHAALQAIGERFGIPFESEPRAEDSAEAFYERIPPSAARRHLIAGLRREGRHMIVATAAPLQPMAFTILERSLGMPVQFVLTPRGAVGNINRGYEQRQDLVTEIVEDMPLDESAMESVASSLTGATDLLQLARQTPVIRLVNMILFEALRRRASDVHIHPMENRLVIRLRVDGMLVDAFSPRSASRPRSARASRS